MTAVVLSPVEAMNNLRMGDDSITEEEAIKVRAKGTLGTQRRSGGFMEVSEKIGVPQVIMGRTWSNNTNG